MAPAPKKSASSKPRKKAAPRPKKFSLQQGDGTFMPTCVEVVALAAKKEAFDPHPEVEIEPFCPKCHGSGIVLMQSEFPVPCAKCNGIGRVVKLEVLDPQPNTTPGEPVPFHHPVKRKVRLTKATVAAARGKVVVAERLGREPSKAVQKIAEVPIAPMYERNRDD